MRAPAKRAASISLGLAQNRSALGSSRLAKSGAPAVRESPTSAPTAPMRAPPRFLRIMQGSSAKDSIRGSVRK